MNSREIEEYKNHLELSNDQRDTLIGLLLGDGHLETQNGGRTYRLKIEQSLKHLAYVNHLYHLFEAWVQTPPQIKFVSSRGHKSENVWFQTLSHQSFRFYAQQFYDGQKKRVPKLIHRWMTPRGLAYWFMDDGSMKSKESKAVIFNTQGFQYFEIELMIKVLTDSFSLQASIRKQDDGYQIYISGNSYERFVVLIEPYILDEMRYKLPKPRQNTIA